MRDREVSGRRLRFSTPIPRRTPRAWEMRLSASARTALSSAWNWPIRACWYPAWRTNAAWQSRWGLRATSGFRRVRGV